MAREIPEAVRAAAGLAATVLDEARRLPETLPGLPVRVLGLAMQLSMKLQQQYAGLVARGDELFTGLRGEDEPGLATFDDDEPLASAERVGRSAFDRVAETVIEVTEDDASAADQALDELAIEELVDGAPAEAERRRDADGLPEPAVLEESPDADAADAVAEAAADIAETVDVPTADGAGVETVEATVTDEGVAAVEPSAAATGPEDTTTPESGTAPHAEGEPAAAPAVPVTAPVEGYDDWSVAQLRGRLRGYQAVTVADLVAYEEANRAREPYLRMLRNRLAKLDEQAVEASPLAPRG
jgi:hypothetical protein